MVDSSLGGMAQLAGFNMPNMSAIGNIVVVILISIFIICIFAALIFVIIINNQYNKRIVIFRKINGKITPIDEDKGFFEKIGMAGDYWLKLKKYKKILSRPKKEIAKNTFWYFEREDGEWLNFILEDIDEKLKIAKAEYIDEDMRLQRLGIEKNLRENFKKQSFWEKWGGTILSVGFILIVTICLVVLFQKLNDLTGAMNGAASSITKLAEATKDLIITKSGGMLPVNATKLG